VSSNKTNLLKPKKHKLAPFFIGRRHHQTITTVQRTLPFKKPVLSARQNPNVDPLVALLVATSTPFVHIPAALVVVSSLQVFTTPAYFYLLAAVPL
jgi:hypothetical protein